MGVAAASAHSQIKRPSWHEDATHFLHAHIRVRIAVYGRWQGLAMQLNKSILETHAIEEIVYMKKKRYKEENRQHRTYGLHEHMY